MDISFLGQMAWKSALISGAALALAAALRTRPAADRAAVLRAGMLLLLLLPVVALSLPALRVEAWALPETPSSHQVGETSISSPALAMDGLQATVAGRANPSLLPLPGLETNASVTTPVAVYPQPVEPTPWGIPTQLVLFGYLIGLLVVVARLLAGLWTLRCWTRSARPVACPEWLAEFERARSSRPTGKRLRLLVCDAVPSPLSWGWLRPVILIDPDTLDRPEGAEAILAHEVAHVVQRDWLVLILSRLVTALFWFNPLVWLLEREVVQHAEQAADRQATEQVEPARYAQTLLTWAQDHGAAVPAHGIAPTAPALARRITAVLDERLRERPASSAWTAFWFLTCIGFAMPVAALELVSKAALVAQEKEAQVSPPDYSAHAAPSRIPGPAGSSLAALVGEGAQATVQPENAPSTARDAATAMGEPRLDTDRAIETADDETVAAARRRYQSNLTALQAEHNQKMAAARNLYQSNLRVLEAEHNEAIAAARREQQSDHGAYQTKYTAAVEAFQTGYQANTEAFQTTYTEATEAFQTGYQVNLEAFQAIYGEPPSTRS